MFWTKRLKNADADADSLWVLSYGDLVTLLLVIFVMIAAMGELRADRRFNQMRQGVRQAFGFSQVASVASASKPVARKPTLLERLEEVGFKRESKVHLVGPADEPLGACDVLVGDQAITLRIAGRALFAADGAELQPNGAKALRRIAESLAEGVSRIEVTSYGQPGLSVAGMPSRDGMDFSYARGRAVVNVLTETVARERLFVTARGQPDASSQAATPDSVTKPAGRLPTMALKDADCRVEITVHAAAAAGTRSIAEKGVTKDGR